MSPSDNIAPAPQGNAELFRPSSLEVAGASFSKVSPPFLTVLNFSAGAQSSCLLEMVLRGDIEKPTRFVVIGADPGMEDSRSYWNARKYRQRCEAAGIDILTAPGPNLYRDIINLPSSGRRRIDNPPYWTRNADGSKGKLKQGCTEHYKIDPMRRELRRYMEVKHGVSAGCLRPGMVESWIGFAADEWHRCSESDVQYIRFRYPLIEMGMDRAKVVGYFLKNSLPVPPRSVCLACFSNGLKHYQEMYMDRPDDWERAVEVDNAVEKWKALGITKEEVFVSSTLMRLRDLPAINFGAESEDMTEHHCNSGVCFL
jgi:hypothetical protein